MVSLDVLARLGFGDDDARVGILHLDARIGFGRLLFGGIATRISS